MGGMTFYIYLINKKLRKEPHYINEAILLSPAGFHGEKTLVFRSLYWVVLNVLSRITDSIALPTGFIEFFQKFHKDLVALPATRDLITKISMSTLGGSVSKNANADSS